MPYSLQPVRKIVLSHIGWYIVFKWFGASQRKCATWYSNLADISIKLWNIGRLQDKHRSMIFFNCFTTSRKIQIFHLNGMNLRSFGWDRLYIRKTSHHQCYIMSADSLAAQDVGASWATVFRELAQNIMWSTKEVSTFLTAAVRVQSSQFTGTCGLY